MRKQLLSAILLTFSFFIFQLSHAQTWVEMMKNPDANFYETVQEFEDYWSTHTIEKGKGYKPFRRWQDFMAPRVYPKGDVKQANRAKDEFLLFKQSNPELFENASRAASWTLLGPNGAPAGGGAGRINFVRIHPTNSNILYAGSPAGGLWITTNGGTSWSTNTDQLSVIGCTDIAIDPTNTQVMYLATGDGDAGDTYSIGVLKSTDGGGTWNTTGLTWTITQGRTISRILVNPTNTQIVLAATSNGIYRSTDGGTSWTQEQTGSFQDMEFMPGSPATIYASGTTFWKSTDSGNTFTQITSGVPTNVSRIAIATTDANAAYVYLLAANNTNSGLTGVYRSTNNGTTFTTRATSPNLLGWSSTGGDTGGQGWYDLAIAASPTNADVVIVGGINIWRSTNGGTNWTINGHWTGTGAPYVHADIHDLVFLPGNGTTYYSGNDGGVFRTTNSGTAWTDLSANMAIAQQYELGLSTSNATRLVTGHQDNGTNLMNGTTWTEIYGGDGMQCFIDRTNNNTIYASYVYGDFQRSTNGGGTWTNIVTGLTGTAAWEAPIHQDPVVANTLYCGYQNMFKSTNQGTSWSAIGTLTGTGSVVEFDVAPSNTQVIYAIKSNAVFKTTNGGTAWTNVTGTLPIASAALTYVEISPTDPNKVWVTFSGYSTGNKVYMTTNGGTSWTNYSTGLPNIPANCIVYQTGSTGDGVYLGTDVGVYYRDNTFASWQPYLTGLPNVIVRDLEIYYATGKIRAATFGRGTWESDLFSPGTNPPAADFVANNRNVCVGSTVVFTDLSSYTPTSWSWNFGGGGTPNTSTAQNPSIVFNTPGTYTVTLTATNANGNDTETKTAYITVSNPVALPLVEGFQNATFPPTGWAVVDINANGTWARTTAAGGFGTSTASALFDNYNIDEAGTRDRLETPKYDFNGYSSATMTFDVAYARYNATYSDTLEVLVSTDCGSTYTQVYIKGGTTLATRADLTTAFTPTATEWRTESVNMTPYVGNPNVMVAFRNRGRYGNNIYLDNVNITGVSTPLLPVADFSGTPTTICAGQSVSFTNLSTGSPTSYSWTFAGGTPATSTATSPTVTYATAGTYAVTLIATNASGSDTETKTGYIVVNALPTATAGSNSPLCAGSTLNLTTPTVAGATYSWSGPGGYTSTQQNPSRTGVTTAMAGTYTVTVTANGCSNTSSVNVVINAAPTSTAASNSPVCTGSGLNLTTPTVAGATYSWTGPNSFTSTSQNPTISGVTAAAAGSYSVTVTASGCSATSSTTVVVNTTPTATAGSNSPLCVGQTLNLTTPTVAGATYSWSGPGAYTSTAQNPTRTGVTTAMAGTYTVTVTANGCSATSSVTVVINTAPTASAASNTPVCSGNTINLTTTTVAGATYSWTGPNSFTSTSQNPTIASATTAMSGTYTVTTTLGSCTATSSTTVTVNATPTATAGSNSPICSGATLNLTTPTVAGATYAWSGPGGYTSTTQNPTRPSATTAMSGAYTVTVTSNGCIATSSVTVTINTAPTASAASNSPLCAGSTINLTTNTVAGATYSWTGPNAFTSTSQNPTITGATTAMSGTYTVTVNNGCTATSSTTVTVNPSPAANAGSNSPICSGATLNLTTTTVAGATYAWTGPGGYTSTVQNPSRPSATTAMSGTYTVTVTSGGCSSSSSVIVTVNNSPTANATSNTPVCSGSTINLSTNAVTGATYSWTGPNAFTSSVQSPVITGATTAMSGTYTVTVNNGCTVISSTTVTVNASPTALAGSNSPVCSGNTLNLTTTTVAGATYSWSGPGGYTSTAQNPTRPSSTTAMSGTYTVTVTANGCTATSSVSVIINATPTATATSNSPLCAGQTLNLSTNTVAGATYSWTGPGGYTSTAQNPTRTNVTTAMSGTYTVTVTANGCTTTSSVTVTVNALPTANATSNSPLCAGNTINLSTTNVAGATYSWTGPGGFTSSIRNPSLASSTTAMSGTYTVTVTNGGCSSTSSVTVTVNPLPTATAGSNSPLCVGQTLNLTTPTVAGATYAWTGPGAYTSTAQNPSRTNVTTAMSGNYTVTVTANGCTSTSTVAVVINANPTTTASSNSPVCSGNAINLSSTAVTGATYSWSGPGAFTASTQNATRPSSTTAMSGSYTVTVTANGCSATSSTTVTVNQSPTATASSNSPICAGTTLTLTTPAVTGATYGWTGPGGYTASTRNASRTNATTAMSGVYTVTVTSNGCSTTSSVTVVINNAPTTTASSNSPVCAGGTINLTTTTVSGATYSWSGPNSFTSTAQTPTISNATTVMAGNYTVTVNNGCTASSSTTVVVNAAPIVIANTTSSAICDGSAVTLTGSGANTYAWNNSVQDGVSFIPGATNTYTVTGTSSNGCTDTDQITITVNSLPTVVANASASAVCFGTNITLTGSGAVSYAWDNSVTNGLAFIPASTNTYTVIGTDANNCQNTDQVTVTVHTLPTVTANASANPICDGEVLTLTGGGAESYTWDNSVSDGVTFTPTGTFTYTVVGSDLNNCQNTAQVTVVVNPLPVVSYVQMKDTVCNYLTNVSLVTSTPTGGTYSGTGVNGNFFNASQAGLGSHLITYTYVDANGCANSDVSSVFVEYCKFDFVADPVNVGIEESNFNMDFQLMPNPSTGEFTIVLPENASEKFTITIFDAIGKLVWSTEVSENIGSVPVNLSHESRGMYHVLVRSGEMMGKSKLIKD